MKIMVVGDVHFSQYSSILRSRGKKFSSRLENLIQSLNWVEDLAYTSNCDKIVYLGDFLDKPELNAEEISALDMINWSHIPHVFLVGNHEAGRKDLVFNSANLFSLKSFEVVDMFFKEVYFNEKIQLLFLPYIAEDTRKPLEEHILDSYNDYDYNDYKTIIFSHNDIKGFQMGNFISKDGFSIEEIENNCDLYLNGHLHNGGKVTDKIINVGNLTGQNFSEDAFKYDHVVLILDTKDLSCAVYENPHAFNFYKLDFIKHNDIDTINDISFKLKHSAVCTIKCCDEDVGYLRKRFDPKYKDDLIPSNCNIVESRFIIEYKAEHIEREEETISLNHLDKFREYVISKLGNNSVVDAELQEVCR